MRIWYPFRVTALDDKRLLGEHNEILIVARAGAGLTKGYRHHPETLRWVGHSWALWQRHEALAAEMVRRGFNHRSPWPEDLVRADEPAVYPTALVDPLDAMCARLNEKQGTAYTVAELVEGGA